MKISFTFFVVLFGITYSFGQIKIVPVPKQGSNTGHQSLRAGSVNSTSIKLPIWEDFSGNLGLPDTTIWSNSENVWINNGFGLNAPSINVATFDGTDQFGNPYSLDPAEVGICDSLVSKFIDLTQVPVSERNSLFLSFYYQKAGQGELPDPSDFIELQFKTKQSKWVRAWPDDPQNLSPSTDSFTRVMVQVVDTLVQSEFQFRFLSTGRKSGPYDSWNIDYIYFDRNRTVNDFDILDRAITSYPNSIFKKYTAIPMRQFFAKNDAIMDSTRIEIFNYETSQPVQGIEFSAVIKDLTNQNVIETLVDRKAFIINSEEKLILKAGKPDFTLIKAQATGPEDSLFLQLEYFVDTGDTLLIDEINPATNDTSYVSAIDLRINDTIRREFTLHNYFSYDDGGAEFGAGINQSGGQLAYRFILDEPDTLIAVQMYFPNIGGTIAGQPIEILIYRDLNDGANSLLFSQPAVVQASSIDQFKSYSLSSAIPVRDTLYVAFKQATNNFIPVGLDKNTNSGNQIYFNVNGKWERNADVSGSLMIRPVFGKGEPITSLIDETINNYFVYPNPSSGIFNISGNPKSIVVFDMNGKNVAISTTKANNFTEISILDPHPGIFILQIISEGHSEVRKLLIR